MHQAGDLRDPRRSIEAPTAAWSGPAASSCAQRPMADFGLEYEANFIGHTRYLSDTGGRWSRQPVRS